MNKKTRKRMKDYPVASPMWWEAFEEEQKEFDRLQVRFNRIFVGMLCIPLFAMFMAILKYKPSCLYRKHFLYETFG